MKTWVIWIAAGIAALWFWNRKSSGKGSTVDIAGVKTSTGTASSPQDQLTIFSNLFNRGTWEENLSAWLSNPAERSLVVPGANNVSVLMTYDRSRELYRGPKELIDVLKGRPVA